VRKQNTAKQSDAFGRWMRTMPRAPRKVAVEIELSDCDWTQLLLIMQRKGWTLDKAVSEVLGDDRRAPVNEYLLAMDDKTEVAKGAK
jgi:hypothetical protein